MQVSRKMWIVFLGLLGALALAVSACGGDDEAFKIGVMESITGPGETYGNVAVQAKQMAVDEINAAGGVNGRMIELIIEDSKCSAQDAITAYRKLTDVDEVKIILGTSCSGAMLGAAPLAEADGVIMFSGLATNPDIANAGDYIFRTSLNDAQLGIDTGNLMWADGVRNLATITEATDYAEGVRGATVAQFEKRGGTLVAEERYATDVIDFRTQLTKLLSANPDGVHLAAQGEASGGTIVKQLRELGYDGPIYSEVVPVGATALEVAGEAATGLKAITTDLDPNNTTAQEVLRNFRERYQYVTLPWYIGSVYDDVYITAECLGRTDDDQDADGFRDCLYGITWSGAIGDNYSFDGQGRGRRSLQPCGRGPSGGGAHRGELRLQGPGPRTQRIGRSRRGEAPSLNFLQRGEAGGSVAEQSGRPSQAPRGRACHRGRGVRLLEDRPVPEPGAPVHV